MHSVTSEYTNILTVEVREHLINNYQNHNTFFTDSSILDWTDSGAGFVIPELKVQVFLLREDFFPHIHTWVICNINGIKLHMQYSVINI